MDLLATSARRRLLFGALYLSEGAPIGFAWWLLPATLRAAGHPVERIASLTALLVLPWALKFAWAPLVDTLRSPRWTLRSWIVSAQLVMGISLLPLVVLDARADFTVLSCLLLVHAFAAATQDAAVDALAVATTAPGERGAVNAWMQAGMLLGRGLFGGVALWLVADIGLAAVTVALVGTVWASLALVALAREPAATSRDGPPRAFLASLRAALRAPDTWRALLFAAVSGAGFEAVGAVAGPYLIDRGLSTAEVGQFFALPALAAMLAGAMLGGHLSDRLPRRRAVGLSLVLVAALVLLLAASDGGPPRRTLDLLTALYLGIGLFVAASYALFMDLTDPRLGATQFSAFMGATNLCESWSAFAAGRLVGAFGYPAAFATMGLASLLALPVLARLGTPRRARSAPP